MSSAFNKFSSASSATHYQNGYRQRIPQQQGVGQTLPAAPVGTEPHSTPPPPPGAMDPGTQVTVGQHKVVIQVYLAEGSFAAKPKCPDQITTESAINNILKRWLCTRISRTHERVSRSYRSQKNSCS